MHYDSARLHVPLISWMQLLTVRLSSSRFAFRAADVREIIRAVAIAPLPAAGSVVEGAINVRGQVVPVLDLRARFGLPAEPLAINQHLVIVTTAERDVAFRVDEAEDLIDIPDSDIVRPDALTSTARHVAGVAALPDGAVVIADLATFLSRWEADALDAALAASA
jgi:purine-binding chemotaxis protein CheW